MRDLQDVLVNVAKGAGLRLSEQRCIVVQNDPQRRVFSHHHELYVIKPWLFYQQRGCISAPHYVFGEEVGDLLLPGDQRQLRLFVPFPHPFPQLHLPTNLAINDRLVIENLIDRCHIGLHVLLNASYLVLELGQLASKDG